MIDGIQTDRWKTNFFNSPAMTYAEALLWVATRDVEEMAEVMAGPRDWNRDQSASYYEAIILLIMDDRRSGLMPGQFPHDLFYDALRTGRVQALGRRLIPGVSSSGHEIIFIDDADLAPIPATAWLTHKMGDAHPVMRNTVAAVRQGVTIGLPTRHGWGDLYFVSDGVFQAFPGRDSVAPLPRSSANDSGVPKLAIFARSKANLREARRNVPNGSTYALAKEMGEMFLRAGGQTKSKTLTKDIESQWRRERIDPAHGD